MKIDDISIIIFHQESLYIDNSRNDLCMNFDNFKLQDESKTRKILNNIIHNFHITFIKDIFLRGFFDMSFIFTNFVKQHNTKCKPDMRNILFCFFLIITCSSVAQNYRYIGVEDGLSNRRVYSIQKDQKGYMWFLTQEGIDRFNGKQFKHYKLVSNGKDVNSFENLNKLYTDTTGTMWEIGKNGQIFRYNILHDNFQLICDLKSDENYRDFPINYSYIDANNNIWLCTTNNGQYIYNIGSNKLIKIQNEDWQGINNMVQIEKNTYCFGTDTGFYIGLLKNNKIKIISSDSLSNMSIKVNELYYHKPSNRLFIGCFFRGVFVYDLHSKQLIQPQTELTDININCIKSLNQNEILIATDGAGVYKMNVHSCQSGPYITADYNNNNKMNGNTINDIYIDDEKRIWMANYPIGITVLNNRFPKYEWIKHAIGNKNSLINDQVNAVIEDSDGDLWFATNNGISLLNTKTQIWTNYSSSFHYSPKSKTHIYITLCEVSPGIIWAGGYASGIYEINKKTHQTDFFTPAKFGWTNMRPDKYIRSIFKDSHKLIWVGGYYHLKCFNLSDNSIKVYPNIHSINTIIEKDSLHMWIGTANGLYMLNKKNGKSTLLRLPGEAAYIHSLYQEKNGPLYIGTANYGLFIYDDKKQTFTNFQKDNCALISNNIYTILPSPPSTLILATENSMVRFDTKHETFHNWTKEQGLMSDHFNSTSGTYCSDGKFYMGTSDGVIAFPKNTHLPMNYKTQLVFSDFRLFYQTVYSGDENSPLKEDIDRVKKLELESDQNIFSIRLSSINYDYPSNILYSWKLAGFYDKWNKPSEEDLIRFTNLDPGKYTLHVRAISREDQRIIEEKSIDIVIAPPFYLTVWALIVYFILGVVLFWGILRYKLMKKERKTSADKINFFVNTAHDIRTPLSLIKAPLDELLEDKSLSPEARNNIVMALRSTNVLFRLITNLINFEKADVYSPKMHVAEYELYSFLEETIRLFRSYAESKNVKLTYETNFRFLNVWFDRNKMDSILKNLMSNAIKYTPENGQVTLSAYSNENTWTIEIRDTGIGIPENEQKKLFKLFFRGSNAINSKISGSGIGLLLIWKLVKAHKGEITYKSAENQGSCFKVTFRHGHNHFKKAQIGLPEEGVESNFSNTLAKYSPTETTSYTPVPATTNPQAQRILIVEDNDELRAYLKRSLSETYVVFLAGDGEEALEFIKNNNVNLIISDIMMPTLRGDQLAAIIKNNIETSHIPIILLTALSETEDVIKGLNTKADKYITKPFDIGILKAEIANLLANRAIWRQKFTQMENMDIECPNCENDLDMQFMVKTQEIIMEHIDDQDFTVDILCTEIGMSRTSLYNKIKALTDQSPSDLIRSTRMNHAAHLLKTTSHTIGEIADMVGFNDPKYFTAVFKKQFTLSPSKYAQKGK